uniref:S41 family peptidase n=1 Tax=Gracilibacillus oryzae TaxID=1672701 RepID=UPI002B1BD1C9|nr:hypothetical protein [Gracilibacillus oryzae]
MNIKKRYIALIAIIAVVIGAAGTFTIGILFFGNTSGSDSLASTDRDLLLQLADQQEVLEENMGEMSKVVNAFTVIKENYVEEVDDSQLIEGAIQGMLQSLDDPYSVYMDAETMKQFNEQIESSFEGIGAEVSLVNGNVTIVAPIKDSPAEKAGLKPNDQI